ncbi:divergent polysaccharide deacetylase family protein [Gemmobacter lutimaris]|uniref:divergent polysaccharide deacetylase family protein n=1 Tax=Gemmobacter lutimaris TaxID=2306023 RepID=UPI001F2B396C|nr:divergent polysaccharide deacetylase family protein [Gemmobacter lutimaris]
MRGFLSGVISGGIVGVLGLGVLSQLLPPPASVPPVEVANLDAAPAADSEAPEAVATPEPVAAPEPATPELTEPQPVAQEEAAPSSEPPQTTTEAPEAPQPAAEPAPAPDLALAPAAEPAAPEQPALPEAGAEVDAAPEAAELPPVPPLTPEEEAMLAPVEEDALPAEMPAHAPPAPDASEEAAAPAEPLLDRPQPGLRGQVEGVTTNRLPSIDVAPPSDPADDVPVLNDDPRPIARYAVPFDNPAAKPLYAIVLADDGKAGVDRNAIAALPLPVTIALDPTAPDAEEIASAYRAAGKEVAMLATGLPKGATAADVQVTFAANADTLPQAVAVVDLPQGGFQNDRRLASDVVPVIKDQGRGLVTFDRGLNTADQVARRESVPSAVMFRQIDGEGESVPVMRRYLDRAAFKAAQDGKVVVYGTVAPDTIAALLEWSVEGRAGSVALAPLTAVLSEAQ